jgi:excisionase family DNA binding protein
MTINLSELPEWAKLEVSKSDLLSFANTLIAQTQAQAHTAAPEKDIITFEEACQFLHLAKPTLYGLTSRNEIPFLKKSRKIYFRLSELEKYLLEGRRKTKSEIAADAAAFIEQRKTMKTKR